MALSEQAVQEIQDMVWALADDMLSPEDTRRLEEKLLVDAEARQIYVQCLQLQADLHFFFNPDQGKLPHSVAADFANRKATPVITALPTGNESTGNVNV